MQPKENGSDVAHELLSSPLIAITQPGYVYIYLSNEETNPVEVYFDDFQVTQTSAVVQSDDYYPFGATFNSYSRENSVLNKYLYQRKEYQEDLSLNLFDFGGRQYDPWAVFTTTPDPHAFKYPSSSPYSWASGNPLKYIDPTGKDVIVVYKDDKGQTRYYDYKNGSTYADFKKQNGGKDNAFVQSFHAAASKLNEKGAGGKLAALENRKEKAYIAETTKDSKTNGYGTIEWNPTGGLKTDKNVSLSPTTILNHEVDHKLDALTNPDHGANSRWGSDKQYNTKEERRVITGSEQTTARALGEIGPGQVTRENHEGKPYPTTGPTTTDAVPPTKKDQ